MTQRVWQQLVYGKLVTSSDGPIVRGYEYACTGSSAGFPQTLRGKCQPGVHGIGTDDRFLWQKYPWLHDGGGIAIRAFATVAGPFVVAARVRGRSESGPPGQDRFHAQALYLATPAQGFDPADIGQLAGLMRAEPMLETDTNLPTIATDGNWADDPLPGGWLEPLLPLLQVLMSGHAVSTQDWNAPASRFLTQFAQCLLLVPATLAWRVPCGAALASMDGSLALGHGMRAENGIRVIAGDRRGTEGISLESGDRYVAFLAKLVAGARTLRDAQGQVAAVFPHLAHWDSRPAEEAWPDTAAAVVASLQELDRLEALHRWLASPSGPPDMLFVNLRSEALRTIVASGQPQRGFALVQTLSSNWQTAWAELLRDPALAPQTIAMAHLLGLSRNPDDHLADAVLQLQALELPQAAATALVQRVCTAVDKTHAAARWMPLLEHRGPEAGWRARVREALRQRLWWRMLDEFRTGTGGSPDDEPLLAPQAAMWRQVLHGEPVQASTDDLLRAGGGNGALVDWAVARTLTESPLKALRLAAALAKAGQAPRLATELQGGALPAGLLLSALCSEVEACEDIGTVPILAVRALVLCLARDPRWRPGGQVAALLAAQLGQPAGFVLLGYEGPGTPGRQPDALVKQLVAHRLGATPSKQLALAQHCGAVAVKQGSHAAVDLLRGLQLESLTDPVLRALVSVVGHQPLQVTGMDLATRQLLVALLQGILSPDLVAQFATRANSAHEAEIVLALTATPRTLPISARALGAVIDACTANATDGSQWLQTLARNDLTTARGWRLLATAPRGLVDIDRLEAETLSLVSWPAALALAERGWPIADVHLNRCDAAMLSGLDEPVLVGLLATAERLGERGLRLAIGEAAMRRAAQQGIASQDIAQALAGRSLLRSMFGSKPPDPRLDLAVRALRGFPKSAVREVVDRLVPMRDNRR